MVLAALCRQLNEMRTKLSQLKQLETAYSNMQMVTAPEPGAAKSRPVTSSEAGGTQSQSPPRARPNEALSGSGSRARDAAAGVGIADEAEDGSFVPLSLAPPPRPRPPKNYRCVPQSDCVLYYQFTSSDLCSKFILQSPAMTTMIRHHISCHIVVM